MAPGVIFVTGYAPFGAYDANASWEAVRSLHLQEQGGHKIEIRQIPVTYKYVDENIPTFWKEYSPILTIHVGVNPSIDRITLESLAHRTGYELPDAAGVVKESGAVCDDGPESLAPKLPVAEMAKSLTGDKLKFAVSSDAGRFLCEYVFYTSLRIDAGRTLFVHVPILNKPYSAEELTEGLRKIIAQALSYLGFVN